MKKLLFVLLTFFLVSSCQKKIETLDYTALIVGKWVANSYQKDGTNTVENGHPYSLSKFYEHGWEFSANKQIRYKNGNGWSLESAKDNYVLVENKILTLSQDNGNSVFSTFTFQITEFTANKLTVHSDKWKTTFFLTKEP